MDIEKIVKELKAGNQEAWQMIVNRYSKNVYNMALNFAGNSDDASDITQDIFLKIYNNIHKFNEEYNFTSWLLRLSKNHCIDYWRKNKHQRQKVDLPDHSGDRDFLQNELRDHKPNPEQSLISQGDISFVRQKLLQLPPDLRALIIMRDIQAYSYQQIAEHLDIPLGTTKSRINRARTKLAKIILDDRPKKEGM